MQQDDRVTHGTRTLEQPVSVCIGVCMMVYLYRESVCICLGKGDGDMQLWHSFKESLIGKLLLQSDTQTRLVVQGTAQLCISHISTETCLNDCECMHLCRHSHAEV